ncbi:hypothetical protein GvMRE_IIg202 [endosymbiont GvMRE of Glomus versiforme]|nr:hypothetical protein GvMRE_IIg202 [endosymbiont GvMRE of Glomus versiforme]
MRDGRREVFIRKRNIYEGGEKEVLILYPKVHNVESKSKIRV